MKERRKKQTDRKKKRQKERRKKGNKERNKQHHDKQQEYEIETKRTRNKHCSFVWLLPLGFAGFTGTEMERCLKLHACFAHLSKVSR